MNGEWGSVCKKGLDDRTVGKICATFGYNDGVLKNVQGYNYETFWIFY